MIFIDLSIKNCKLIRGFFGGGDPVGSEIPIGDRDGDGSVPASISGDGEQEVTSEPGGQNVLSVPGGDVPVAIFIINLLVRRTSWLNRPGGGGAPTCVNT